MRKWKVEYKEVGRDKIFETTHWGDLSKSEVVEFFGLDEPDVTWYRVTEIIKNLETCDKSQPITIDISFGDEWSLLETEDYLDEILPLFDEDMDISVNVNIDKSLEESEYKILISLTQVEES